MADQPTLYGRAVTMDEIITAVVELPETVQLLKWYGVGLGVLLLYIAAKVSKR
jgi:hypothetical protein